MKAQELASVVPDIFLLEKYISQVGVCTLWKQPWGTPWGCHGQNISLCPSLTASLSVLSHRSRRAPLPSRGSRASSPHLPSKVLCRSCPCPCPCAGSVAPLAGGHRGRGGGRAHGWHSCHRAVPSHRCLHTARSLPGTDRLPGADHLFVLGTESCCSGEFICLGGKKKFLCFD